MGILQGIEHTRVSAVGELDYATVLKSPITAIEIRSER